jgi:crossover junction endodeoxyribonuclease RuvC
MLILGIDPGTATTGYGIIESKDGRNVPITYGAIITSPKESPPMRLLSIYTHIANLIDTYNPDVMATERLFFSKNETTAFSVGRTVGVVLLLAAQRGIPTVEYTPMEIKQAVVGYGGAEKKQVQFMVQRILSLQETPKPDDVADALAICITHSHSSKLRDLTR